MKKSAFYFFCIVIMIAIGYVGVYPVFSENNPAESNKSADGERLYAKHCASCHPNGGDIINPSIPVIGSPMLKSQEIFTKFNRNPLRPDGSKGIMPAFSKENISDQDMMQIYQYIIEVLSANHTP
ncbi:MAG: cytochrome c [Syntrophales bacterium]|jgi:mono/diheme cytochrome c family protein